MESGICRLCGKDTSLSYEHVPPKVAFNKNTKFVSVDFEEYVSAENALKNQPHILALSVLCHRLIPTLEKSKELKFLNAILSTI